MSARSHEGAELAAAPDGTANAALSPTFLSVRPLSRHSLYGYSPSPMKPSQVVIQHEAIERAADLPHVEEQIRNGHYVPLWFLLEHPFREVEQAVGPAFLEAGFAPEVVRAISLPSLVSHAFREGSSYWSDLAAGWLSDGFPVDESIASAVEMSVKEKRGSQRGRHLASGAVSRWQRSRESAV